MHNKFLIILGMQFQVTLYFRWSYLLFRQELLAEHKEILGNINSTMKAVSKLRFWFHKVKFWFELYISNARDNLGSTWRKCCFTGRCCEAIDGNSLWFDNWKWSWVTNTLSYKWYEIHKEWRVPLSNTTHNRSPQRHITKSDTKSRTRISSNP